MPHLATEMLAISQGLPVILLIKVVFIKLFLHNTCLGVDEQSEISRRHQWDEGEAAWLEW